MTIPDFRERGSIKANTAFFVDINVNDSFSAAVARDIKCVRDRGHVGWRVWSFGNETSSQAISAHFWKNFEHRPQ